MAQLVAAGAVLSLQEVELALLGEVSDGSETHIRRAGSNCADQREASSRRRGCGGVAAVDGPYGRKRRVLLLMGKPLSSNCCVGRGERLGDECATLTTYGDTSLGGMYGDPAAAAACGRATLGIWNWNDMEPERDGERLEARELSRLSKGSSKSERLLGLSSG
jgi:hypothetical protein